MGRKNMKILIVQIALTFGLGIPPSWTKQKRYNDYVAQFDGQGGHAGWWMQPAHLTLKSQPVNTWAKISHGQKSAKQTEAAPVGKKEELENILNETIDNIKQSDDYEQLKDFIDEKFYDNTQPKASGQLITTLSALAAILYAL